MNDFFSLLIAYSIPIGVLLLAIIFIILSMGAAVSWTKYLVFGYLVAIMLVPETSNFGTLSGENTNNFWVKGSKTFFFPFTEMFLFGTWFLSAILLSGWIKKHNVKDKHGSLLGICYLAYGLLFMGYVVIAMFGKDSILLQFQAKGVINILWQGMVVTLLLATIRTEKDLKTLTYIIIFCLSGREAWGLVRYIFLGGDPQNYYANFGLANLKITFFDINDSIFATLMVAMVTWKLLVDKPIGWQRIGYAVMAILALSIPVLSARRTGQGGLIFALILLFLFLPRGRRSPVFIILVLIAPLGLVTVAMRDTNSNKPFIEKILGDANLNSKHKVSRFSEQQMAWKAIIKEPFFGIGPSGYYEVDNSNTAAYIGYRRDFVHNGFAHVLLKTGFVGLTIFIGIFLTFILDVKKGWQLILPEHKALAVGAMCGLVAQLPNMFFESHVIEKRSMLVGGVLFAIPLICIAVARRKIAIDTKKVFTEKAA